MTAQRVFGCQDIRWDGRRLPLLTGRLLAIVEPDTQWAGMYRVRLPSGHLTDIVNLTRAKDAAVSLALSKINTARRIMFGRAA
jgi:hypothetical protein